MTCAAELCAAADGLLPRRGLHAVGRAPSQRMRSMPEGHPNLIYLWCYSSRRKHVHKSDRYLLALMEVRLTLSLPCTMSSSDLMLCIGSRWLMQIFRHFLWCAPPCSVTHRAQVGPSGSPWQAASFSRDTHPLYIQHSACTVISDVSSTMGNRAINTFPQ